MTDTFEPMRTVTSPAPSDDWMPTYQTQDQIVTVGVPLDTRTIRDIAVWRFGVDQFDKLTANQIRLAAAQHLAGLSGSRLFPERDALLAHIVDVFADEKRDAETAWPEPEPVPVGDGGGYEPTYRDGVDTEQVEPSYSGDVS